MSLLTSPLEPQKTALIREFFHAINIFILGSHLIKLFPEENTLV